MLPRLSRALGGCACPPQADPGLRGRKPPQNKVPGTRQIVLFGLYWRGDLEGAGFEAFLILKVIVLLVITQTRVIKNNKIREHKMVQARPLC